MNVQFQVCGTSASPLTGGSRSHLWLTGCERWPWRRSVVRTIGSQRQTALAPWIRHLSELILRWARMRWWQTLRTGNSGTGPVANMKASASSTENECVRVVCVLYCVFNLNIYTRVGNSFVFCSLSAQLPVQPTWRTWRTWMSRDTHRYAPHCACPDRAPPVGRVAPGRTWEVSSPRGDASCARWRSRVFIESFISSLLSETVFIWLWYCSAAASHGHHPLIIFQERHKTFLITKLPLFFLIGVNLKRQFLLFFYSDYLWV